MSNFWVTSDNKKIEATGAFTSGGGKIENIPDDTTCLALIDEAGIAEYEGTEYVNLRWTIAEPIAYKGRKIFQKIRIYDANPKKADKAKEMLLNIDANCGGKLAESEEAPTDKSMAKALLNKLMLVKVLVWELNGNSGNWISSVAPRKEASLPEPTAPKEPSIEDIDSIPW